MGNQHGITIGINRYQFFQPLNYAQADAQALRQFLVKEAGWLPEHCLLLTDTSPPLSDRISTTTTNQSGLRQENRSTYPTKANIIGFIKDFVQKSVQPGDLFWFFFSGYGVTVGGEDYLMPIDGNPSAIAETGIPIKWLFEQLKAKNAHCSILLLLDINRSQALHSKDAVGMQTVQLAQSQGIATVLSCQLDQFSHEAGELGHGLFTAGLLEALRYDSEMTLLSLDWYLRARLPELSSHHWQPVQIPLMVTPSPEANERLILYPPVNGKMSADTPIAVTTLGQSSAALNGQTNTLIPPVLVEQKEMVFSSNEHRTSDNDQKTLDRNISTADGEGLLIHDGPISNNYPNEEYTSDTTKFPWWQQLIFWGGGVLLLSALVGGVVIRNWDAFFKNGQKDPLPQTTSTPAPEKTLSSVNPSPIQTDPPVKPTLVSPNPQPQKPKNPPRPNSLTTNGDIQASQFSKAITQFQKIKPGEIGYEEAQENIAKWSGAILNIAKERANKGNVFGAIAAAQLVPSEQPLIYKEAQQAIAEWKQSAKKEWENLTVLQAAKGLIRPGQASSYNRAIIVASKVPADQPGGTTAQKLINDWSKTIYSMAQSRAKANKFDDAIQTANLVPENTPLYGEAQKAIAKWKENKK